MPIEESEMAQEISYLVEPTDTGKWRVTSPDDPGIHVVQRTPIFALAAAQAMRADLLAERAAFNEETPAHDHP